MEGTSTEGWEVTASLAAGPGGLVNNLTCTFTSGICTFSNLAVDTMGENYTLQFDLTDPTEVTPATSTLHCTF